MTNTGRHVGQGDHPQQLVSDILDIVGNSMTAADIEMPVDAAGAAIPLSDHPVSFRDWSCRPNVLLLAIRLGIRRAFFFFFSFSSSPAAQGPPLA